MSKKRAGPQRDSVEESLTMPRTKGFHIMLGALMGYAASSFQNSPQIYTHRGLSSSWTSYLIADDPAKGMEVVTSDTSPSCHCPEGNDPTITNDRLRQEISATEEEGESIWDIVPLQHTRKEVLPGVNVVGDTFNPFHNYLKVLDKEGRANFTELPMWHTWVHFCEPYHNHFYRFRGKEVVLMEVGVQSGGKIGLLRDYFGPGFRYIGIDVNPSTKMFESADWITIEIGDSANVSFWDQMKVNHPKVDIFLDDGGHVMLQQKITMREMLPHIHPEGVYICEDLATSWASQGNFQGRPHEDARSQKFLEQTMVGLVHKSMDWLQYGFIGGGHGVNWRDLPDDHWPDEKLWWRVIPEQVKHIHFYNQMVVYEKGVQFAPKDVMTVGSSIAYGPSGEHPPTDWDLVMKKIQTFTKSPWNW